MTMRLLVTKGVVPQAEMEEALDKATLLLEEIGLASGEEGHAAHEILTAVLAIVSGASPQKPA